MQALHTLPSLVALFSILPTAPAQESSAQKLRDRIFHGRAVEAVVWAMPLLNFKGYRDGHAAVGVGYNTIGYNSKVQDWRFQTATPNNTTPYISFYWKLDDGPVVIEIPPAEAGIGIFGTIMDAWQRPLDDVGAAGRDKGAGARYVVVPEGYRGDLPPRSYVYTQRTNHGFCALRPIMDGGATPENLAKSVSLAKKIRVYPLSRFGSATATEAVDVYGKNVEMTPKLDGGIYAHLHAILEEETVEPRNLAMMGMLARIGIQRGQPFAPDDRAQSIFADAAKDALEYLIDSYHITLNKPFYAGKKWSALVPPGAVRTDWTYEFPDRFDYDARGALYYAIITSIRSYGTATFYLDLANTPDGAWLSGENNYRLRMPANVPVRDFWSITTYDLETASYLREVEKSSIDSNMTDVQRNADGSVDIYFGPKPPTGNERNWLPTTPGRRFFLLARFYGPEKALLDKSFELNDIERVR